MLLGELEAELEGRTETYLLPLAPAWDETQPPALAQQLALARIRQGRRVGYLTDGFAIETMARAIIRALCERSQISGRTGTLEFIGTEQLDCVGITEDMHVHWLSAEQSNSSLIVGDMAMVKLIRKIFPGIHPEVEMTRYLTKVGYKNTAPLFGEVARTASDGERYTLIIVQGAIRNQGDAWTWMLGNLRRGIDEVLLTGDDDELVADQFKPLVDFAGTVGQRLGELHVALSQATDDPDFQPVEAGQADVQAWQQSVTEQINVSLDILRDEKNTLEPEIAQLVQPLLDRRDELVGSVGKLAKSGLGTLMTRHHGDFHLGQILVAESDAYLIDFEGEPARDLAERRAKSSPLRDVAGFLRSLSYLAATADLEQDAVVDTDQSRRQSIVAQFGEQAEQAFLDRYQEAIGNDGPLAMPSKTYRAVLDLFLLEKAAYEIGYEARNRPKWLPIPLGGFAEIAKRLMENAR
jgi:maltose alpha-D-glucosyltransferase/alpha-amylase